MKIKIIPMWENNFIEKAQSLLKEFIQKNKGVFKSDYDLTMYIMQATGGKINPKWAIEIIKEMNDHE